MKAGGQFNYRLNWFYFPLTLLAHGGVYVIFLLLVFTKLAPDSKQVRAEIIKYIIKWNEAISVLLSK